MKLSSVVDMKRTLLYYQVKLCLAFKENAGNNLPKQINIRHEYIYRYIINQSVTIISPSTITKSNHRTWLISIQIYWLRCPHHFENQRFRTLLRFVYRLGTMCVRYRIPYPCWLSIAYALKIWDISRLCHLRLVFLIDLETIIII